MLKIPFKGSKPYLQMPIYNNLSKEKSSTRALTITMEIINYLPCTQGKFAESKNNNKTKIISSFEDAHLPVKYIVQLHKNTGIIVTLNSTFISFTLIKYS